MATSQSAAIWPPKVIVAIVDHACDPTKHVAAHLRSTKAALHSAKKQKKTTTWKSDTGKAEVIHLILRIKHPSQTPNRKNKSTTEAQKSR